MTLWPTHKLCKKSRSERVSHVGSCAIGNCLSGWNYPLGVLWASYVHLTGTYLPGTLWAPLENSDWSMVDDAANDTPYMHIMGTLCALYRHLMGTLGEFWFANGPDHSQWHYWYNNLIYMKSSLKSLHVASIDELTDSNEPAIKLLWRIKKG